jgi:RHS repeat-associated protein
MTRAVKKDSPKTALYPLFRQKFDRFLDKKAIKTAKKAPAVAIHGGNFCQKKFAGKERDAETGLYYYGARYLDPRAGRWLSGDPALGEYVPSAPVNEEARKRNGSLPGMGGVFNYVNLHVYHYAGNNPVKYTDPKGLKIVWNQGEGVCDEKFASIKAEADSLMNSGTEAGRRFKELDESDNILVTINVNKTSDTRVIPQNPEDSRNGKGTDSTVYININDPEFYTNEPEVAPDFGATLAHEVSGHAYNNSKGTSQRRPGDIEGRLKEERTAVAMENEYRSYKGLNQRKFYDGKWDMPIYDSGRNIWEVYQYAFDRRWEYSRLGEVPGIYNP